MVDNRTLSYSGRISWKRLLSVGRYYWPRLRWQVMLYPVISVLVFIAYALLHKGGFNTGAATVLGVISYMVEFAPLVLALRNDRETDIMLPVCGTEKFLFLIGYFLIIVPLLAYLPSELLSLLVYGQTDKYLVLRQSGIDLSDHLFSRILFSGVVSNVAMILTCLWAVIASRTHRILKGILYPLIISVISAVISVIYSLSYVIRNYMNLTSTDPDLMATAAVEMMWPVIHVLTWLFAAYSVFAAVMLWRSVTRRQL